MAVNLQKGQKVDLTKNNQGLSRVIVGLGWDAAEQKKSGLFGLGRKAADIDCDASAILLQAGGKLSASGDVVFYNNLRHTSGAIMHQGDNLTGDGDGDDEQIVVELKNVPANYEKIVFVVTIYQARERSQHFGMIRNAYIRIVDAAKNEELCRFNLSDNYDNRTAMIFGEIYRYNGEWKFSAIGEGTNDNSITEMAARFH